MGRARPSRMHRFFYDDGDHVAYHGNPPGSNMEKASLHYSVQRQPYEWTGDLLLGIAFLIAVIAHALRLTRDISSMLKDVDEPPA